MAGMSEAGWMIGNPPGKREIGSVETPFRFKTVEILNQQGKKCNVGEEGEIVVKGKSIFKLPKIIRFLEGIPKTKNGKVAKRELLKLILEEQSS
jgi:acyl-coenzyme A synthetase/AMP-(fatty) acid ligase